MSTVELPAASGGLSQRLQLWNQERLLRLQPLLPPPSGFVFSPSGGSLEIRAFLEWNISPETQVSPRARSINVSESERARQESPCGLGPLVSKVVVIKTTALPCGDSGEPAGKTLRNLSQVLTCRPEQVLTTSGERQSQEVSHFFSHLSN